LSVYSANRSHLAKIVKTFNPRIDLDRNILEPILTHNYGGNTVMTSRVREIKELLAQVTRDTTQLLLREKFFAFHARQRAKHTLHGGVKS
jgi:hypothetical protein